MPQDTASSFEQLVKAIQANSAARVRGILQNDPELARDINRGTDDLGFGATPLIGAVQRGNREIVDLLLHAGADPNQRSDWWAGGFSPLDSTGDAAMVDHLMARGAVVDVHVAARRGMRDKLVELLAANPALANARGGDGQTPLHVAHDIPIAQLLLSHGAEVNARDVDHESTPAQYLVRVNQNVVRYLIGCGSDVDILMAAALGDLDLVRRLVAADPRRLETTVSPEWFPMQNPRAGGTIYIWTLGSNKTPHLVAREFGHQDVADWLMANSPDDVRLAQACLLGDAALFAELLTSRPGMVESLSAGEQRRLIDAAANNNAAAVRLMLEAGWPADVRDAKGTTALHWASWLGNADMVRDLLRFKAPLDAREETFGGTPVGWAMHGSLNSWKAGERDYSVIVAALADAGAELPPWDARNRASDAVLVLLRERSGQ